ncbi:hypothetical protein ABZ252_06870 [Streptomyces sp. NPDC006175]|uniref:hypothetical protein n=1 Tax=Streptomyces sp. NPDC006175 TaxID=3154471 RepID=UPI0033B12022
MPEPTADGVSTPVTSATSEPETTPAPGDGATPAAGPPAPSRRDGRFLAVALSIAIGAACGAVGYTVHKVGGADRTARTTVWQKPEGVSGKDPAGDVSAGRTSTELSKLQLPVPPGYTLGPDSGGDGNDSEISGKKATAALKETGRGLAGKQRRELDRRIDKLKIQGVAVRTYRADSDDLAVEIKITKMKDRKAVRDTHLFRKDLLESVGEFRKGPAVKGHKHAACFLVPKEKDASGDAVELAGMQCTAYDGELSVNLVATGIEPFEKTEVVNLLKDQLDHIASPGEYV